MRAALRLPTLETTAAVVLAATIFAFALGSSSVESLNPTGGRLRWVGLGVLTVLALALAVRRGRARVLLSGLAALSCALVVLAAGSTLWSVAPRLTFHRAASLGFLILAAAALAYAVPGASAAVERLLVGVLGGAVAVALAGLVLLAVDRETAAPGDSGHVLSRYQGFGERPTTDAMLYALALPLSLLLIVPARARGARSAGIASFVLLAVPLVASGARGPQFGAVLGLIAVCATLERGGRLRLGAAVLATVALAVIVGLVQMKSSSSSAAPPRPPAKAGARPVNLDRYSDPGALNQEFGHGAPSSYVRSFWHSSGRTDAWRWALRYRADRPALGYGFGTEELVFEDHYLGYQGSLVSSSWIGLYLQLGAFGVALLAAIWVALGTAVVRVLRRRDSVAVACAAVVVAAFPLTVTESWIYSVGNVATVPFWVVALLLGALVWGKAVSDGA